MSAMRSAGTDARIDARFDSLQQTIVAVGGGLIGTLIVASAGVIATQL